jgi:hypothetical protein
MTPELNETLRRTGQIIAPFDTDDERELFRSARMDLQAYRAGSSADRR